MRNGSRDGSAIATANHSSAVWRNEMRPRCATFENNERNTRAEAIISQLIRCRDQVSLMQRRDANTRALAYWYKVTKKVKSGSGPGVIPNKTRSLNQCHAAEINSRPVISAKSTTVDAAQRFIPARNVKCCAQYAQAASFFKTPVFKNDIKKTQF